LYLYSSFYIIVYIFIFFIHIVNKKDIDEYSKKITKEIKEEAKTYKIEKAEKKKDDKKKKNNLDEDGNEKPKRALTKYQQYIRDNQQRIRDEFPELSNTERFSKLAEEWKAYKATLEDVEEAGEAGEAGEEATATDMEIANVSEDEEDKPKKQVKEAKKPKKEIKPKASAKTNADE
jgi:hypothetical protein